MPTTIPEMTLVRISSKGMKLVGFFGISASSQCASWLVIPIVVGGALIRRRAFGRLARSLLDG